MEKVSAVLWEQYIAPDKPQYVLCITYSRYGIKFVLWHREYVWGKIFIASPAALEMSGGIIFALHLQF
jgi:hypothetical protein